LQNNWQQKSQEHSSEGESEHPEFMLFNFTKNNEMHKYCKKK